MYGQRQQKILFGVSWSYQLWPEAVPWGGTVPPLLSKVIFVNRLKPMRKNIGGGGLGGGDATNHS